MIQILLYTITAIVLYVVSDWILLKLEQYRGKPFASRNMIFFAIILVLSLLAFEGLQRVLVNFSASAPDSAVSTEQQQ